MHEIITREIEIECLPDDIPEEFIVDVTELMIGQAVRASASIPNVFLPVKIGNKSHVDGGLVSPVPVRAARGMGAAIADTAVTVAVMVFCAALGPYRLV